MSTKPMTPVWGQSRIGPHGGMPIPKSISPINSSFLYNGAEGGNNQGQFGMAQAGMQAMSNEYSAMAPEERAKYVENLMNPDIYQNQDYANGSFDAGQDVVRGYDERHVLGGQISAQYGDNGLQDSIQHGISGQMADQYSQNLYQSNPVLYTPQHDDMSRQGGDAGQPWTMAIRMIGNLEQGAGAEKDHETLADGTEVYGGSQNMQNSHVDAVSGQPHFVVQSKLNTILQPFAPADQNHREYSQKYSFQGNHFSSTPSASFGPNLVGYEGPGSQAQASPNISNDNVQQVQFTTRPSSTGPQISFANFPGKRKPAARGSMSPAKVTEEAPQIKRRKTSNASEMKLPSIILTAQSMAPTIPRVDSQNGPQQQETPPTTFPSHLFHYPRPEEFIQQFNKEMVRDILWLLFLHFSNGNYFKSRNLPRPDTFLKIVASYTKCLLVDDIYYTPMIYLTKILHETSKPAVYQYLWHSTLVMSRFSLMVATNQALLVESEGIRLEISRLCINTLVGDINSHLYPNSTPPRGKNSSCSLECIYYRNWVDVAWL